MDWIEAALQKGAKRFRLNQPGIPQLSIPDEIQAALGPYENANTGDSEALLKIVRAIIEWALQVVLPSMARTLTREAQEPHAQKLINVWSTWSESNYTTQGNTDLDDLLWGIAGIFRPGQGGMRPFHLGKALNSISYLLEGAYPIDRDDPTNNNAPLEPTSAAEVAMYVAVILWVHHKLCDDQANSAAIEQLINGVTRN